MSEKKIVKVDDIKNDAESIKCPVERSRYLMAEFLAGPMCGRCFPCSMGSYEARILLKNLMNSNSSEEEVRHIKTIAEEMLVASMCKKGKDIAKYILEWMDTDVFNKHLEGICPEKTCKSFIEYRIIPEKCTMCGICSKICKYNAIHGEKVKPFMSGFHPFEIRQQKCVKCGDCLDVCPTEAIILVDAKATEAVEV
jgi:formate hydrogenlyase subunit 6/NADH:ubiquinone oxidoreductase subunit I